MPSFFVKTATALVATLCSIATFAAPPTPEVVFDNYVKAIGGEPAIRAIKTRYFDGTMDNKRSKVISRMTVWQKAPNLSYAEIETLGSGSYGQGYDGKEAWAKDANGNVKVMTGVEAASIVDSALITGDLDWKTRYSNVKTVGDSTFEGKPALELSVTTIGGTERSIYFDTTSWLELGVKETVPGPSGPDGKPQKQFLITIFEDYREVGGVKAPCKFTQKLGDMEIISTFINVEVNTEQKVNFEKPASPPPAEPAPAKPAEKKETPKK